MEARPLRQGNPDVVFFFLLLSADNQVTLVEENKLSKIFTLKVNQIEYRFVGEVFWLMSCLHTAINLRHSRKDGYFKMKRLLSVRLRKEIY